MRRALIVILAFAVANAHAATRASVAMTVNDEKFDDAALELTSNDALMRATAARVAMVRGSSALVPRLREALTKETDANAAREQIRALVLLGNDDDVAWTASQLPRFPSTIDAAFADAVARLGIPRALDLYTKHVRRLRHAGPFFAVALWGHPEQTTPIAARVLGAKDVRGYTDLLRALDASELTLAESVAGVAAASDNEIIRMTTLWHLVHRGKSIALEPRENVRTREAFARELVRRLGGAEPLERPEWLAWLKTDDAGVLRNDKVLTRRERTARKHRVMQPSNVIDAPQPAFTLPMELPRGLASEIVTATRCSQPWFGGYAARVDRAGRVAALNLDKVQTDAACRTGLGTMLRLSLAQPRKLDAPRITGDLIALRNAGEAPCADAAPVTEAVEDTAAGVVSPKVIERAEPHFPRGVRLATRGSAVYVVAEATISATGCVRDVRLVSQSPYPELNASVLTALSKWKFAPGTLHGVPVDVVFTLTISFRA